MRYESSTTNRLGNRSSNQDRCKVLRRQNTLLLLLADGMGGHKGGDLAAQELVDSIARSYYDQTIPVQYPENFLVDAIEGAHADIVELGLRQRPAIQPRTTCVACLIQDGMAWWAHVGDSRLYHLRDQQVLSRTRDHTYVEDLYQHNAITEDELLTHPMRNYVTQCLGGEMAPPPVTIEPRVELQPGDIILLCSDGLWGAMPDKEWLDKTADPRLSHLIDTIALQAEHKSQPRSDNISIAAVRIHADASVNLDEDDPDDNTVAGHHIESVDEAVAEIQHALDEYQEEIREEQGQDNTKS